MRAGVLEKSSRHATTPEATSSSERTLIRGPDSDAPPACYRHAFLWCRHRFVSRRVVGVCGGPSRAPNRAFRRAPPPFLQTSTDLPRRRLETALAPDGGVGLLDLQEAPPGALGGRGAPM